MTWWLAMHVGMQALAWEKEGRAFCRERGCSREGKGHGWPMLVLGETWFVLVRLLLGRWLGSEDLGLGLLDGSKEKKA